MQLSSNELETIISALLKEISQRNEEAELNDEKSFAIHCFMSHQDNIEIAIKWVNFVYAEFPDMAKKFVSSLHDDTVDLSTIPCCGEDFKPWPA